AGAEAEEEVAAEAVLQPQEEEPARAEEQGSPSQDQEGYREEGGVPERVANLQVQDDDLVAPDRAVHVDRDPVVQDLAVKEDRGAVAAAATGPEGPEDRGLGGQDEVEGSLEGSLEGDEDAVQGK
ncbi:hypothetical protein ANCCAN_26560, partial [Ancylostoma caninum]